MSNPAAVFARVVVWRWKLTRDLTRTIPVALLTCGHELGFPETDMSDAARHQHIGFELACPDCNPTEAD